MYFYWTQNAIASEVQLNYYSIIFIYSTVTFCVSFRSWVKLNSSHWPASNVWVFIAQLVEHDSANAETMGSKPVEVSKFWGVNLQLLKLQLPLRRSYLHLKYVFTVFLQVTWIFLRQVNLTMVLSYVLSPLLFQLFQYSGLVW